jgi:hypothetical protein
MSNKASELPYYPRFIFNCSDGSCFSTADLELFEFLKEVGTDYKVSRFKKGQNIEVTTSDETGETLIKTYKVSEIEIQQIKYDIDEPTYGFNMNDCQSVDGSEKKWLMEIYIFLELVE